MDQLFLATVLKNEINKHTSWLKLIDRFLTNDIDLNTFLKTIKGHYWAYKDDGLVMTTTNKYLKYYTELVMTKNVHGKTITILFTNLDDYSELIKNDYKERLEILETILQLKNYKYDISDNIDKANEYDYIIPLTSFAVNSSDLERLDKNKLYYVGDNNYTIIKLKNNKTKDELKYLYDLVHIILNYLLDDKDDKIYNYNYIYIED